MRLAVAPSSIAYEQAVRIAPGGVVPILRGPITVDADATRYALLLVALTLMVFWSARTLLERRGVRSTIRAVAWMGIIVAPLAIVQHITAPRLFYWRWVGTTTNTLPYTPFVNRNDFAGWLVMAIPLTLGYAVGRIQSRSAAGEPFDPEVALDNTGLLLGTAAFAMTAALLASLSRSGIAGLAAALLLFVISSRGRMSRRRARWMLIALAAMIVVAAGYTNMNLLAKRFGDAMSEGMFGREAIWRQTWPMVRDFWPVGSGVGTYQPVMVLYQTSPRLFYISHADNEYLQILAEGGALLAVPVALACVAGLVTIVGRLRADRTPLFWMRLGAACGILALAVQNAWEMTLRVPANAILLAIVAAIATREAHDDRSRYAV